jgi:phosphinothricin acetyltransferase
MTLRLATTADLPVIVEIYNSSIPGRLATADTVPVSVESRREWFTAHDAHHHPLWVLEGAGKVIAWVGLQPFFKARPAYASTAEISVYVSPESHGRGIAVRLVQHALDQCPGLGIRHVTALIFGHNDPSLKVFQRAQFQPWGRLPGIAQLDDTPADLVILGRAV